MSIKATWFWLVIFCLAGCTETGYRESVARTQLTAICEELNSANLSSERTGQFRHAVLSLSEFSARMAGCNLSGRQRSLLADAEKSLKNAMQHKEALNRLDPKNLRTAFYPWPEADDPFILSARAKLLELVATL